MSSLSESIERWPLCSQLGMWPRLVARLLTLAGLSVGVILSVDDGHMGTTRLVTTYLVLAITVGSWTVWQLGRDRKASETVLSGRLTAALVITGLGGAALCGLSNTGYGLFFSVGAALLLGLSAPAGLAVSSTAAMATTLVTVNTLEHTQNGLSGYAGVLFAGYAIGSGRRAYVLRAEQAERLLAETRRANAEQAHAAALAERTRIAREIHDVLAHSLAALSVQLDAADALLSGHRDPDRAREYVVRAHRIAREGLTETRRAITALREDAPPLIELITAIAESYEADLHTRAPVMVEGQVLVLTPEAALTIYRSAQEAFTNVRKHAPGGRVTTTLTYVDDAVVLEIVNTLPAGPVSDLHDTGGGYGLTGMRERTELLGGEFVAGPVPRQRMWRVRVRVPVSRTVQPTQPRIPAQVEHAERESVTTS